MVYRKISAFEAERKKFYGKWNKRFSAQTESCLDSMASATMQIDRLIQERAALREDLKALQEAMKFTTLEENK